MVRDGVFELESSQRGPKAHSPQPRRQMGWKESLQEEIDGYYDIMKSFSSEVMEPTDIFMYLSAWTARMSEIKGQLWRGNDNADASQFRIREVEPFIQECERQFKYHSRRFSGMEFDAKLQR
jgi:hypothetical protein